MRRNRRLLLLIAGMTLVLGGVGGAVIALTGGGANNRQRHPAQSSTTSTAAPTSTTAPPTLAPLTGLFDPSGASHTRPALSVKVENTPDARPQVGIDQADVVYEEVVEGNITRFVAVFNSTVPDTIGPVRSVRAEDPDIVWPLGGIFAYSGGAPVNVTAIQATPVLSVDESSAGQAMERNAAGQPSRIAPHNLYGHGPALFGLGGTPVNPAPLFEYVPVGSPAVKGIGIQSMHIGFDSGYDVTYTFDGATDAWNRFTSAGPHTTVDGGQLAPTDVVVQFTSYTGAAEGQTVGEGDVWVFSDGVLRVGRWVRPDHTLPARYIDAQGLTIRLRPGRTWVELLPVGNTVDVTPAPTTTTTTTLAPATSAPTTTTKAKKK